MYNYSLKPQACLPFSAGVQTHMLRRLWMANACMYEKKKTQTAGDPAELPDPTCPSMSPKGDEWEERTCAGNKTLIRTAVYCNCDNSPDMITSHHAGKCVTVQALILFSITHTNQHQWRMHYKCNHGFDPTWHPWRKFVTDAMSSLLLHM